MKTANLKEVVGNFPHEILSGPADCEITMPVYDSRECSPGAIFFCVSGFSVDGHAFVPEAVTRGAAAIVVEKDAGPFDGVTVIKVEDSRAAMAQMSSNFYGTPSGKLEMIGITGTNGKTSVAFMIDAMLREAGKRVGLLGTVINRIADEELKVKRTTPESLDLQALLDRMARSGCTHAVMEVSSHAVALKRVAGCKFGAGALTNVTQDHLDFHKDFDEYLKAKKAFFTDYVAPDGIKALNMDDPNYEFIRDGLTGKIVTFGMESAGADVKASGVECNEQGIQFTVSSPYADDFVVKASLLGRFNVSNMLAMITLALSSGVKPEIIQSALSSMKCVPGRFERVDEGQPFNVIVDYAHTPDGLKNVLASAKEICKGRIIVVFGAGGDRDRSKRPLMGGVAARLADFAIVTSDNPRTEVPYRIMEQITNGITQALETVDASKKFKHIIEEDRYTAIRLAITAARAGDIVVIAGKGHEDYQIFKDRTIYFDDRVVAKNILKEMAPYGADNAGASGKAD